MRETSVREAGAGVRALQERPGYLKVRSALIDFARRKPLGAFGAVVLASTIFLAIFANVVAPYDPLEIAPRIKLQTPTAQHLFGTDNLGRDILSRIIYGARSSIYVGTIALLLGTVSGTILGIVSAYLGGKFDLLVQRVVDSVQAFPLLILAMAVVAMLGASSMTLIIALAIVLVPGTSRVLRGATLSVKENQYVEAARALGATGTRIVFQHILPNVTAPIIILASVQLGSTIIVEASLSFLGLGTPPPTPTWGGMLGGTGRQFLIQAPHLALFPAIAISLAVLGINLFGDGLRDVLDPRLRGSR